MRSILLITFMLFVGGCSDNTSKEPLPISDSAPKKVETPQPQKVEQIEPVEAIEAEEAAVQPKQVQTKAKEDLVVPENETVSGHTIFIRQCASCHGQNGEKSALNKSKIIQGWEKQKTVMALKGYQDGSYGSSMKGIMKAQVNGFSDSKIDAVSEFIASL